MSLGRRACYRSRSLAIINLLATPRDALTFLYPCWFTLSANNRFASTHAANIKQATVDNGLNSLAEQMGTGINAGQDSEGLDIAGRRQGKKLLRLSNTLPESYLYGFKSLDAALLGKEPDSLLKGFRLEPARIRRMMLTAHRQREIKNNDAQKGTWSYNWGIPLFELKQYYRHDSSVEPAPPIHRQYPLLTQPTYYEVHARDIPRPVIWSSFSFVNHIKDLTQSSVSRVMHRHIYLDGSSHVDAVRDALMLLFEDPNMRLHMTRKAFDIAMMFLYKHSEIASVRRLFNLMDEIHIEPTVQTFNIMLRGAASNKDLRNFTMLLRVMIRRGVSPNPNSWVALLAAVVNQQAKVIIFRSMREAGVLNDSAALKVAVCQLLDIEVACHIANGQTFAIFMKHMIDRYGDNWLSVLTGNTLCHLLGENGLVSDAFEALQVMNDNLCKPDNVTLHIFLGHCRRLRRPAMALKVLQMFQSKYSVHPKQDEYDMLFMLAWRSQRMNYCKVIWQVACIKAAVSYRMQELVLRSLLRNTPENPTSNLQRCMKTAGKVIVGVDLGATTKSEEFNPGLEILRRLSSWAESGEQREKLLAVAKCVLKRDLNASRRYVLDGTLPELLAKALELDSEWEVDEKRGASTLWKIQSSLEIKIRAPSETKTSAKIQE